MTRMSNNDASGTKAKIFYMLLMQDGSVKLFDKFAKSWLPDNNSPIMPLNLPLQHLDQNQASLIKNGATVEI